MAACICQSGRPRNLSAQLEHPVDVDRAARIPGERYGEEGSRAAAVPAALYSARTDAMSASPKKLRVGPLPKAESIKLTFACPAKLKANLDRYAALHAQTYGELWLMRRR